MADWFKFYEIDLDHELLQWAMTENQSVAIVYVAILSRCCRNKSGTLDWSDPELELFALSNKVKISIPIANTCLGLLQKIRFITISQNYLNVLSWNERQSDYCQRKSKPTTNSVGTVSEQCRNSIPLEERRGEEIKGEYHKDTRSALYWLNENAGVKYREVDSNLKLISARLSEPEVTLPGVQQMIARQVALWRGTDMEKYLRPETLFNKTKFDSYYANRNSKIIERGDPRRVDRAKGTLNEGVSKQYDLRKVQAARAFQDAQRPGACPDV